MGSDHSSSAGRLKGLDGLRALAAIAVVVHHAGFQSGTTFDGWHGRFIGRLDVGVPVFFALSGFLLFIPVAEAVLNDRPLRPAMEHLWRRALRIYPAFWVALIAIISFTSEGFRDTTGAIVSVLLVQIHFPGHTIGPMPQSWSLATEVSFYAFLPLLARFARPALARCDKSGRRRGLFVILASLAVSSVLFRTLVLGLDNRWTSAAMHWLPATIDYFVIGMALAVARVAFAVGSPARDRLERWAAPAGFWWISAGILFVVVSQWAGLALGLDRASWERELFRQLLYGGIAACLLFPLAFGTDSGGGIRRLVSSGPLEWLGTISYSIYLWHLVFISHPFGPLEDIAGGLQLFDRRFGAVLFVAAIPTLVVSWLSYVIVERAGLALQGWVRRPALDPTPTESAVHRIFGWWGAQSFRARLALIAAGGLILRVTYVLAAKRDQTLFESDLGVGDQYYYSLAGDALARGDGFVVPWHHVSIGLGLAEAGTAAPHAADHPPLTALLAAPAGLLSDYPGERLLEQRLTMCLVGVAVVVVMALLGRLLAGPTTGLIAAAIAAIYPGFWINDGLVMAETPTTLMVAALVCAVIHHRRRSSLLSAAVMGGLLALASLARSESLLLWALLIVPVVLAADRLWKARLRHITVATTLALLLLAPWVVPNLVRFDEPVVLSTNDGLTLIGANSPQTYSGEATGFWSLEYQQALAPAIPELAGADQSVVSRVWRDEALTFITENFEDQPRVMFARLGRLWSVYRPLQTIDFNKGEGREVWASNLALVGMALIAPFSLLGWHRLGRDGLERWPLAVLSVHVSIIAVLFYGIPRFRVPAEVGLVVLAAVAVAALTHSDQRNDVTPGEQ